MEKPSHCTVSTPRSRFDALWLLLLTLGVLLVHGYHPWAEDGGLYVAGIEHALDPSLFPHETAFVTEYLPFSLFTPAVAALVRLSHRPLADVLCCTYLLSTALMLYAALRLGRQCFRSHSAPWTGVALLAAWWTLPIAGTSLFLMDPYVTARSLSTPLSLLAISAAMDPWSSQSRSEFFAKRFAFLQRPDVLCVLSFTAAAVFHPLMAIYALGFILIIRHQVKRRPFWLLALASVVVLVFAGTLQWAARPETPPVVAAAHTRYYWFLAQWQWFEWLGLLGPLAILAAVQHRKPACVSRKALAICRAATAYGLFTALLTIVLAQEHFRAHAVARLQPLRVFLLLYALMIILLGGMLAAGADRLAARTLWPASRTVLQCSPAILVASMALLMFLVQRATFPASIHLELPNRRNPNPWVEAFVWARGHTPTDALFALDARYINTPGEDAQTFRALSLRDAIPDFSKDGGEAANIRALAPAWWRGAGATRNLSQLSDRERDAALRPFGVQWVVLHATTLTAHTCPYRNAVVEVCRLP